MTIIPAILSESLSTIESQLALCQQAEIDRIHLDVIDGLFVETVTPTPADWRTEWFGALTIDVHLMVEEPMDYVDELAEYCGGWQIGRVIGQIERMSRPRDFLARCKALGYTSVLAADAFTDLDELAQFESQEVMLMGIEAGAQGKVFREATWDRIQYIKAQLPEREIGVDGGVKLEIVDRLSAVGVSWTAMGSAIWRDPAPAQKLQQLAAVS